MSASMNKTYGVHARLAPAFLPTEGSPPGITSMSSHFP